MRNGGARTAIRPRAGWLQSSNTRRFEVKSWVKLRNARASREPRTRSTLLACLSDLEPKSKVEREAWDMAVQARDEVSALARGRLADGCGASP